MWLVLGLGNPGSRYAATRHNLGYMVVDTLLQRQGAALFRGPGPCLSAEIDIGGTRTVLVKPTTYVNLTGKVIAPLATRYGLVPEELLAVVDDVHLGFGRLRVRPSGGAGGHNGLQSIEDHLQSQAYPRLRLGIGPPRTGEPLPDHVLGTFEPEEQSGLAAFLSSAADAVEWILAKGVEASRARINTLRPGD